MLRVPGHAPVFRHGADGWPSDYHGRNERSRHPADPTVRVATYTQPTAVTRGSIAALTILIATILLGTTAAGRVIEFAAPAQSGLLTFVWLALYGLAALGLMFGQGINWISWLVRYRILLVLLLLGCILSVAWSVDSRISAERVVHLVGTSLLGIYFGFTVPLLKMLRVIAVVLGGILLASIGAALALPELGISAYEGQLVWSGVLNSKNHLGFWAAAGVLLYIALSDSTHSFLLRMLCYLMAGVCLALLAFSQSATALLAMLVGGSVSLYLHIANRFRLGFARMAVMAVLFAILLGFAAVNIDTAELVGRSGDLTGRGEVWAQTWKLIMARPLSGYGYGVLWFPTEATLYIQQGLTDFTWIVFHAHNGFLQVASEIGLPLAVIALLMVAQQMIEIIYCQYQRQQAGTLFVLAFVLAYLIGNFSEARFLISREFYWILFIALPISMLRQINVVAEEEAVDDGPPDAEEHGLHSPGEAAPDAGPTPVRAHRGERRGAGQPLLPGAGTALVAAANGDRGRSRSRRWQDDDGWEDGLFEAADEPFVEGSEAIDLGDAAATSARDADRSSGQSEHPFGDADQDATQVLMPEDWNVDGERYTRLNDEVIEDRFDKVFDETTDNEDDADDWVDVPFGGAER